MVGNHSGVMTLLFPNANICHTSNKMLNKCNIALFQIIANLFTDTFKVKPTVNVY